MPFITAPQIHNGHTWLPAGSTIEVTNDGTIVAVTDSPNAATLQYEGILCPGFVNAHCHLELSHMRGVVPQHTGLIPFLKTIPTHRNDHTPEQKRMARIDAYNEMADNGIVAVGDIANTADTIDLRAMDRIHMYTFVEAIGFNDARADAAMGYALQTLSAYAGQQMGGKKLSQSVTPHAPYSVSRSLFQKIGAQNIHGLLSIHNQESEEENRYFERKEGAVADLLHTLGIDDSQFAPSGKTSLRTYLPWLPGNMQYLFVHNTYTSAAEIDYANSYCQQAFWCLCPNANKYIENRLPDIKMLMGATPNICIGTDSLASNTELCILSELKTIKEHYPEIEWQTLLRWATSGGAAALQMTDTVGSIEPGKQPGIIHISVDTKGQPQQSKRIL